MKKLNNTLGICICGHAEHLHDLPLNSEIPVGVCWYVGHKPGQHPCIKFKQDNLKFIEQQYEELYGR